MNTRDNEYNETENRGDQLYQSARTRNPEISDPPKDQEKLRSEETTIDMPEVRDIPGQEHVHIPQMGEMADTTISSDDEEGRGVLDELNSEEEDDEQLIKMGTEADISEDDREMLRTGDDFYPSRDEERLQSATMDNTDFEGEPLNEKSFGREKTGGDLDVPGAEDDNTMEESGDEDEENNYYTLGGEG